MSIFTKRPDEISLSDIKSFITLGERETRRLEFKREIDLSKRKQKEEAAKDVCAMANAGGGLIVYGIGEGEIDGTVVAEELYPLANDPSEDLANVLESRITPRAEFQFIWVPESEGKPGGYLIVRVLPNAMRLHSCDGTFHTRTEKRCARMNGLDVERRFNEIFRLQTESRSVVENAISRSLPRESVSEQFMAFVAIPMLGHPDLVDLSRFDKGSLHLSKQARSWTAEAYKWSHTEAVLICQQGAITQRLFLDGTYMIRVDDPSELATDPKNPRLSLIRAANILSDATRVAYQCWKQLGVHGPACLTGVLAAKKRPLFWSGGFHLDDGDPKVPSNRRIAQRFEVNTALRNEEEVITDFGRAFLNKLAWSAGRDRCESFFHADGTPTPEGLSALKLPKTS